MGIKIFAMGIAAIVALGWAGTVTKQFLDGAKYAGLQVKHKELKKTYNSLVDDLTACKNRNVSTAKEVMGKCESGQAADVARQKFTATVKDCRKLIKECKALAAKHEQDIIQNSIDITR